MLSYHWFPVVGSGRSSTTSGEGLVLIREGGAEIPGTYMVALFREELVAKPTPDFAATTKSEWE